MKNKFLLYFIPIALVACNGKQPSNIAKKKVNQDTLPVLKEQVDWRSIQTIDAHNEEDTIVGNFTGKGIDTLYVEEVMPDSFDYHNIKYYMVSSNKHIPRIELYGIFQAPPKLVNERDLDRTGTCEVGYLHTWYNSQWRQYRIFTLRHGKWKYLIYGDYLDTPEWFRHSGKEVAEPGPRKGTVLIHYGVDLTGVIKDTIVKPTFSKITD